MTTHLPPLDNRVPAQKLASAEQPPASAALAVRLAGIGKQYRLFASHGDRLKEALHPFGKHYHRDFRALEGIDLEIRRGEVLGVMGRNGSGKSTLLQIIAGVLSPTTGSVETHGRVAALLELGAGFNPEFTGRDNVLLNGGILGIGSREMLRRMPEIEDFADIGQFFDQPMKSYSTGTFMRVAFAVAINVDPEILIIDEALSVGDAKFQEKCFRKFHEFVEGGATIIIVSHSAEVIVRRCSRAILLNEGRLVAEDAPDMVARQYLDLQEGHAPASSVSADTQAIPAVTALAVSSSPLPPHPGLESNAIVRAFLSERHENDRCPLRATYNVSEHLQASPQAAIIDYLLLKRDQVDPKLFSSADTVDIYFKVRFAVAVERPCFGFALKSVDGVTVYALNSGWLATTHAPARAGDIRIVKFSLSLALNSGDWFLDLGVDEFLGAGTFTNICRRMAIAHFTVHSQARCDGYVDLAASFADYSA